MVSEGYGSEHEALRYFRSLTPAEREEHLWMGLRELAVLSNEMIEQQNQTNGHVADAQRDIANHLLEHSREEVEIAFIKKWGERAVGALAVLIMLSTILAAVDGRIWGWIGF